MKMTKIAVAAVMLFVGAGLFAQSSEDQAFDELYRFVKPQAPAGGSVEKFTQGPRRILFFNMQINISSNRPFNVSAGKAAALKVLRGSREADLIKRSNCIFIYNYVTTDRMVYSMVITSSDL